MSDPHASTQESRPVPAGESRTDDRSGRHFVALFGGLCAALTILAGFDVAFDIQEKLSLEHKLVEDGVLGVGVVGLAVTGFWLARVLKRERQLRDEAARLALRWQKREQELQAESAALARQLQVSVLETSRWRREAGELLAGLGAAIDAQFARWSLSRAEREVALLLLKGLSHKEIATVRHVGEATVRQQAQGIYRKSGLANRNDLAAFFLEDLLLPNREAESTAVSVQ
jgi:DNA-binding CsgD family transcriptional regulator